MQTFSCFYFTTFQCVVQTKTHQTDFILFMPNDRMWLSSSQAIKVNAPMTCGAEDCENHTLMVFCSRAFQFPKISFFSQRIESILLHKRVQTANP